MGGQLAVGTMMPGLGGVRVGRRLVLQPEFVIFMAVGLPAIAAGAGAGLLSAPPQRPVAPMSWFPMQEACEVEVGEGVWGEEGGDLLDLRAAQGEHVDGARHEGLCLSSQA